MDDFPPVGSIVRGRVVSVKPFGVFVELDAAGGGGPRGAQGLVHHSAVADELRLAPGDEDDARVQALEFFAPRGARVWAKVVSAGARDGGGPPRLGLSLRAVDQASGRDVGGAPPGGGGGAPPSQLLPEVGSIHRAVVRQVRPFGAFVELPGFRRQGLVHFTQISDHLRFGPGDSDADRAAAVAGVLAEGDAAWVKVVEAGADAEGRPRVSCSIKLVSQRDGEDLDPGGDRYKPRGGGGGGGGGGGDGGEGGGGRGGAAGPPGGVAAVAAGAVVEWGHLKADVVQYGGSGGHQYGILAAEDEDEGQPPLQVAASRQAAAAPGAGPPAAPPAAPAGRGRGSVLPAWMTAPDDPAAPGAAAQRTGASAPISSVEEALAVLEAAARAKRERAAERRRKREAGDRGGAKGKRGRPAP